MLILSLDSAGGGCGVCVWQDGHVLAQAEERMERGQDQRLMPLVIEVMKKAGVTFDALDRIAVTRGPGSFTGLRIGLAAARGLGLALSKPVIGIDRFSIYREHFADAGKSLLVVIDSRRKEMFCRFYPANMPPSEPAMMTDAQIREFIGGNAGVIVSGDAAVAGFELQPLQKDVTVIAASLAAPADPGDPAFLPRPLYIRAPDVTVKSPFHFRTATTADTHKLADIHAASFGAAAWKPDQIEGSLALPTTQGWVASENGRDLGFILCQIMPEQSEILTLAVRPEAQRRGIGSNLIGKALKTAGLGKVFLEVAADNGFARRLYEKLGFTVSGIRANYYRRGTAAIDAILYERILSEQ